MLSFFITLLLTNNFFFIYGTTENSENKVNHKSTSFFFVFWYECCRRPILSGLLCLFLFLGLGPMCDECRIWASNLVRFVFSFYFAFIFILKHDTHIQIIKFNTCINVNKNTTTFIPKYKKKKMKCSCD